MKFYKNVEQRTEEWYEMRKGKVTGTFLKKIVSTRKDTREKAYYDILADRLSTATVEQAEENAMKRGVRLEDEAVAEFEKRSKKKVEKVGFVESSFSKWVGYSPDGVIKKGKKYPEDVEVKCLSSGNHVRAWLTGNIPEDYEEQIIQGFIVNDDLKIRHVVFYDPRIEMKPYVCIIVERSFYEEKIEAYKKQQREFIKMVDETMSKLVKL